MTAALTDELFALSRRFGLFERDAICCGTVTVSQCAALQHLLAGPQDVSAVANHLGVTVSASTRLIDGLVRKGWLERKRDAVDRRRVLIHLSESGRAEATRLRDLTHHCVNLVLAKIDEAERPGVIRAISLLREAVDRCRDELNACCN